MLKVFFIAFLLILLVACGESGPPPTPTPTPSLGEKIAVIDGEDMGSAHAKRADYLLRKIAAWCSGPPTEERVGDMAVVARDSLLEEFGVDITVLDVLEGVNESTLGVESGLLKCEEVFAFYVVLRGQ